MEAASYTVIHLKNGHTLYVHYPVSQVMGMLDNDEYDFVAFTGLDGAQYHVRPEDIAMVAESTQQSRAYIYGLRFELQLESNTVQQQKQQAMMAQMEEQMNQRERVNKVAGNIGHKPPEA